jgi:hypothetical protein
MLFILYMYNVCCWLAGWLGGYRRGVHFGTREFYRERELGDATQRHFNWICQRLSPSQIVLCWTSFCSRQLNGNFSRYISKHESCVFPLNFTPERSINSNYSCTCTITRSIYDANLHRVRMRGARRVTNDYLTYQPLFIAIQNALISNTFSLSHWLT